MKPELNDALNEVILSRQAAERAIKLKAQLEIKLDIKTKYAERLEKKVIQLSNRPPEKVEVPVLVEVVPQDVRNRMAYLSSRVRELEEKVEQLELVISEDGREFLLPE